MVDEAAAFRVLPTHQLIERYIQHARELAVETELSFLLTRLDSRQGVLRDIELGELALREAPVLAPDPDRILAVDQVLAAT